MVAHDPEALRNGLGLEQTENARQDGEHRVAVLPRQSQDDDPGIILRRVVPDVREVQIQRDENALLVLADPGDGWVGRTAQILVENGVSVMTVSAEQGA